MHGPLNVILAIVRFKVTTTAHITITCSDMWRRVTLQTGKNALQNVLPPSSVYKIKATCTSIWNISDNIHGVTSQKTILNLLGPELFFFILAHPVYKMWIIQEPNTLELWNKLHFEERKNREYTPCLKYSVPIFVEYKMQLWRLAVRYVNYSWR